VAEDKKNFKAVLMRIKIAMVCYPGRSGLTHYSESLSQSLVKFPLDIQLITNKSAEIDEKGADYTVVKLFTRTRWILFVLPRFIFHVLKNEIHVLHFQNSLKFFVLTFFLLLLFKLCGKKIVFTAHDVLPHTKKRWYQIYILKGIYNLTDAIIVHSEQNKQTLNSLISSGKKLYVIPLGVFDRFLTEHEVTQEEARRKIGIDSGSKMLLFFGHVSQRKGADSIIREIKKVMNKDERVVLVIAGESDYPNHYLESLVDQNGLEDKVFIFNRWIAEDEVKDFFIAADAVILPYKAGYTSGILKVAYAFRKPVIATNVGELSELVKKDKSGILMNDPIDQNDVEAIIHMLNSPELLEQYRENISKVVEKKYSWQTIAKKTHEVYEAVIG
jgi:D-inositol-3-phosphate glycosyltransferase